jgi:hypothetical protein
MCVASRCFKYFKDPYFVGRAFLHGFLHGFAHHSATGTGILSALFRRQTMGGSLDHFGNSSDVHVGPTLISQIACWDPDMEIERYLHNFTHTCMHTIPYHTIHTIHYIHYITLHYIALHYITLHTYIHYIHYIHYITLHCIT